MGHWERGQQLGPTCTTGCSVGTSALLNISWLQNTWLVSMGARVGGAGIENGSQVDMVDCQCFLPGGSHRRNTSSAPFKRISTPWLSPTRSPGAGVPEGPSAALCRPMCRAGGKRAAGVMGRWVGLVMVVRGVGCFCGGVCGVK